MSTVAILPVSLRIFPSSPDSRLNDFCSRCKFSTLTTRQPMVEFNLLDQSGDGGKSKSAQLQESFKSMCFLKIIHNLMA